jgi:bifunctional non-homologous end joining protein LigD
VESPATVAAGERRRLRSALGRAGEKATLSIEGASVAVSHLDRVYWPADEASGRPAVTKRDYLRYLIDWSLPMLAAMGDRPLTLFRWPEGIGGRRVLVKHWETRLPAFVDRVEIFSESKGRPDAYVLCNNLASLVWLGHMGTLEFHAWHSRVRAEPAAPASSLDFKRSLMSLQASIVEYPDYMLFDIDPFLDAAAESRTKDPVPTPAGFASARRVALWLKALLDSMSLVSFVKTSGKTGLHVVVPIERTLRYDAVRAVARAIAEHLARAHPVEITVDWSVRRRTGKVFIDYNMNARGKSLTVPYSPRGLPGAPVSMPLSWPELQKLDARTLPAFAISTTARRRAAPWTCLRSRAQDLETRLRAAERAR